MAKFQIVVLGCTGGPYESDLSAYLLLDVDKKEGILLDAGALLHGLKVAYDKGAFRNFDLHDEELNPIGVLLHRVIKAYLISHAHLDHVGALVTGSQVDVKKTIYGLNETINLLHENIFNNKIWPNYVGEDSKNRYQYHRLHLEEKENIASTRFSVIPFALTHARTLASTAFFIGNSGSYFLYFGDTSSDFMEKARKNELIWKKAAPFARDQALKVIFLECSYPNMSDEHGLYGHLTPQLFFRELEVLANLTGSSGSIEGVKVVVTHRKDSLTKTDTKKQIADELTKENKLGVDLIFPEQGMSFFC